jgi:hypothetical protein
MYIETTDYFERRQHQHGVDVEVVLTALANEVHRERQPDGRIRVWGYVEAFRKNVRVILLEDGFTVLNAFPDRSFKPPKER